MFARPGDTLRSGAVRAPAKKNGVGEQWHKDFLAGAYA
jgi:hypothetical protein